MSDNNNVNQEIDFQVTVGDGKYTYVSYKDGSSEALRHNEKWRETVGDGLILAMAHQIVHLEAKLGLRDPDTWQPIEQVEDNLQQAKSVWAGLGNIPINEDDEIDEPFLHFEKGTDLQDIWHYIEETYDCSVACDLMRFDGAERPEGSAQINITNPFEGGLLLAEIKTDRGEIRSVFNASLWFLHADAGEILQLSQEEYIDSSSTKIAIFIANHGADLDKSALEVFMDCVDSLDEEDTVTISFDEQKVIEWLEKYRPDVAELITSVSPR